MSELTPGFDPARDHWRGGGDAPVTLLVFGDYQCPYTRIAERVARRLLGVYGPSLRVAFRNLPLTEIHPRALAAAAMAEAAGAPERFWVLHDTLFDHQDALEDDDLRAYAAAAGVDPAAADWGAIAARLQDDVRSAEASGAAGTPTLFVNGRLHVDGYKQPVLAAALERAGATVADR